jgi:glycogen debranching enzyme
MSSEARSYNPLGYHTGSVWPHDNAICLDGMRRYGFDHEATVLAEAFIDAALAFRGYQVPELYSGDHRSMRLVPTPYPVASRPQAWSAASLPFVMASMVGLRPKGDGDLAIVRPLLPRHVDQVQIRGIRCASGMADLTFRRVGDQVAVEVEQVVGNLSVIWEGTPGEHA